MFTQTLPLVGPEPPKKRLTILMGTEITIEIQDNSAGSVKEWEYLEGHKRSSTVAEFLEGWTLKKPEGEKSREVQIWMNAETKGGEGSFAVTKLSGRVQDPKEVSCTPDKEHAFDTIVEAKEEALRLIVEMTQQINVERK